MTDLPIRFANIIMGPNGALMMAVPACQLDAETDLEISLRIDGSFDIFQGINHVGHIESTPEAVLKALATTAHIVLIEVDDSGPVRTHKQVRVRNFF